jgi:hypothetical protein
MKNNRCCSVKYILAKNVRSNGNSIIHSWISMLLTGICETMAGAVVLRVDSGVGCVNRQMAVCI